MTSINSQRIIHVALYLDFLRDAFHLNKQPFNETRELFGKYANDDRRNIKGRDKIRQ